MTPTAQAYEWVKTGHWSLRQFREWFDAQQRTWVGSGDLEDSNAYQTPPAAQPVGQAPCVRHCESTAYEIVIRGLKGDIERMKAAQRKPLTDEQARVALGLERPLGVASMRDVRSIEAAHGITGVRHD
jgi:hypothetical protein